MKRNPLNLMAGMMVLLTVLGCQTPNSPTEETAQESYVMVIHGGAGTILKEQMTPEKEEAYKSALEEALRTGYEIIQKGGTSLDAVEKTIHVLENTPLFNAARG